jgi:hypothetical protein
MTEFKPRYERNQRDERGVMILTSPVRRYRPRGQNVTAFHYTDPGQVDQLLDWLSRIERRTVHGRVTGDGVVQIHREFGEELSIGRGSFIVRSAGGVSWTILRPSAFLDRFEPLPIDAPIFTEREVA